MRTVQRKQRTKKQNIMKSTFLLLTSFVFLVTSTQKKCNNNSSSTTTTPVPNITTPCSSTPQNAPNEWSLIFSDEFDNDDKFDSWNDPWMTGYPWGQTNGDELQYYTRYDKVLAPLAIKEALIIL